MNCKYVLIASSILLLPLPLKPVSAQETSNSRFNMELESGPVWQSRNNVQIPNNENGTRFSLADLVGKGPLPAARLYLTWNITGKHGLRALLAPLSFTKQGKLPYPVDFTGASFDPDVITDATYKFNSWRLTYRYLIFERSEWNGWIGFTAKIRDAKIKLEQSTRSTEKTDLGFVPLLHLSLDYRPARKWSFIFDLDALAGGPGRAEDLSLKLSYRLNERFSISGGYRTVEGGADVEEVYNFAWFHYAVASMLYRF